MSGRNAPRHDVEAPRRHTLQTRPERSRGQEHWAQSSTPGCQSNFPFPIQSPVGNPEACDRNRRATTALPRGRESSRDVLSESFLSRHGPRLQSWSQRAPGESPRAGGWQVPSLESEQQGDTLPARLTAWCNPEGSQHCTAPSREEPRQRPSGPLPAPRAVQWGLTRSEGGNGLRKVSEGPVLWHAGLSCHWPHGHPTLECRPTAWLLCFPLSSPGRQQRTGSRPWIPASVRKTSMGLPGQLRPGSALLVPAICSMNQKTKDSFFLTLLP